MATREWWRSAVVYQIYPRSWMDGNHDGIGDLPGITAKLDYLQWLGIDSIWLSPIFPSPMKDFGYDVSDYIDIHPMFGTLADFDALLNAAHARGIKVLLDLVPNHTSDQHAWFLESKSSRDNPKRDWFIWQDAKPDGSPPNNWLAYFGGSAWTWDEHTQQYYMHNFLAEQPDLNYRNPEVLAAMLDQIRFWLDRGVDGFRVDVIDRMLKDDQLRDNPMNPNFEEGVDNPMWAQQRLYSENRPGIHALIAEFRKVFDSYADRVMVGEIGYFTDPAQIAGFYANDGQQLIHLPFNFALIQLPWRANAIAEFVAQYEKVLPDGAHPNYVMGNHDMPRLASRVGAEQARIAAMMLLTLRGTPFVYYGEELGMVNGDLTPDQYQDPQGINMGISRDFERTPFQWSAETNAGFSTVSPWLPVAPNYHTVNVETQRRDPHSILNLYRALLIQRQTLPALTDGTLTVLESPENTLVYRRDCEKGAVLVALNFSHHPVSIPFGGSGELLITTALDKTGVIYMNPLQLRADEGVVVKLR